MERYHNEHRRRDLAISFLAGTALSTAFIVGLETNDAHSEKPAGKPRVTAEATPRAESVPETLDDFSMVVISDPSQDKPERHSAPKIESAFSIGDELVTEATDGRISLPDAYDVRHVEVAPKGVEKLDGEDCYTKHELLELGQSLQKVKDQHIALIVNEAKACYEKEAGAWAYYKENVSVFPNVDGRIVAHELGHNLGLPHHTVIGCRDKDSTGYPIERTDIAKRLINDPRCDVTRYRGGDKDGEIDEYASWQSVMGHDNGERQKEAFHPLEIEKIAPGLVQIPLVDPTRELWQPVVPTGEGVRGIKLALPTDHPLRKYDSKMETISITTAQDEQDDMSTQLPRVDFSVTAASDELLYDIVMFPGMSLELGDIRHTSMKERTSEVLYNDAVLDVSVVAERAADGGVQLHVRPYDK